MRDILEWKSFQSFAEMDEKERRKAIRDNFETIIELMESEHPELAEINTYIQTESDRLGLETIPFISDHRGHVTIRSASLCCAYQNHFSSLELNPKLDDAIQSAREVEKWFSAVFQIVPNIEVFYDSVSEEIFVSLADCLGSPEEREIEDVKTILARLKNENLTEEVRKELAALELELIFRPEETTEKIEWLLHRMMLDKEKKLSGVCSDLEEKLKIRKNEMKELMKSVGFEVKLTAWLSSHPQFVFSSTGELIYMNR